MKAKISPGPDPLFPYLDETKRFPFPSPDEAKGKSIIAWGGNLSPGMLLSAYEQGIFPWYNEGEPIIWQSPDPRFILYPEKLRVSHSMKKVLRRGEFEISINKDFEGVINGCREITRPGQEGTWITDDMISAYIKMHKLGYAHSAEAWSEDILCGGCYGIRLGKAFFGESMFAKKSNASKAAFITFAQTLFADGVFFIDCQMRTAHLESLGGEEISRREFLVLLRETLE